MRPGARALLPLSRACAVQYRSRGQRQYARADWLVPQDLSRVSTIERHHRVRDQLERPRRQGSQRRSELRATIGSSGIGMPTPLSSEHHGDDHLEPLQAIAAESMAAVVTVLCVPAVGCAWSMPSQCCGEAVHAQSRLVNSTAPLGAHSCGARERRSSAVCGAPELPERPAQHTNKTQCAWRRADKHHRHATKTTPVCGKASHKRTHSKSNHVAHVGGVRPVPVQMWQGHTPGSDVARD